MRKFHRLAPGERYQIQALLQRGVSLRAIAQQLKRHVSTISREVRKDGYSPRRYDAHDANRKAVQKRHGPRLSLRCIQGMLEEQVRSKIISDWSPEQIAGRFKILGLAHLSYQTIYRFIARDKLEKGGLWKHLRILRKQRKDKMPRCKPTRLEGRIMIDERPSIVEERRRLGDYERDTVYGNKNGPLLLTLVDRTSRFTHLAWIERKCSELVHQATVCCLQGSPLCSITNDNGTEFSRHRETSAALGTPIFFSKAYRAWERGTNENTNGLLRQYFPKKKPLDPKAQEKIKVVAELLNHRPRKTLGFLSPYEIQEKLTKKRRVSVALDV